MHSEYSSWNYDCQGETQSSASSGSTGDKIAQAVLVPIIHCGIEEVPEHKLDANTERGDGGFGSTGNK